MRALLWITIVFWAQCLVGCDQFEPPPHRPFPEGELRQAFPSAGTSSGTTGVEPGQSSFERAIAEASGSEASEEQSSREFQSVPLGHSLVVDVPARFDEWSWTHSSSSTVIRHRSAGTSSADIDVLIYSESFSPISHSFPSLETRRFLFAVDPSWLVGSHLPDDIQRTLFEQVAKAPVEFTELSRTAEAFMSSTRGLGLGFKSNVESFSGWRWIGRYGEDLTWRAARVDGRWTPSVADATVSARPPNSLDALVQRAINAGAPSPSAAGQQPAWMILARISRSDSSGLHLAMICQSPCSNEAELIRILESVRVRRQPVELISRGSPGFSPFVDFVQQTGLPLQAVEDTLSVEKLRQLIDEAKAAEEESRTAPEGSSTPTAPEP